jgi:O-antigen ligase
VFSVVYASGVFDPLIDQFVTRGAKESGRERLWAMGLPRVLDSPWIGVGEGDIRMPLSGGRYTTPHNGLLHLALAAGIGPLICFLIYLFRVGVGTLRMMQKQSCVEDVLLPPLVAFGIFQIMVSDYHFMYAWGVVAFALATVKRVSLPSV